MGFHHDPQSQGQFASIEEAEAAFKQSAERLQFAMDAITDGVWDWNVPTGKVYCSPTYFRMLGYEPENRLTDHSSWLEMVHPQDQPHAWESNQACVDGIIPEFQIEFRMRHRDGSWRWIRSRGRCVTRAEDGCALRLVGTHTDIDGQKQTEISLLASEANLRESEAKYRVMFEKSSDALFVETLDGAILDCNEAACRLYGYTRAEFLQLNATNLVTPDVAQTLPVIFQKVRSNGSIFVPSKNTKKNGEVFPVEANLQQVIIQGEAHVLATIHDISAREHSQKVQAALYQISEAVQAVASLDELYRTIHTIISGLMYAENFYIALYEETTGLLSFPYCVDELDPTP
ncbi:MAG: PAS domain S-box protein, partial [Anaerolineaceae bacterium]|nr:PAS domain S-box protein [Anaerolineaceae bacterium]